MTLGEFVDTINAELLRGSEFGVRRRPSGLSRREAARARALREENQHYADEQARAEYEAERRWQNSGMGIVDYIRSRAEEGDPAFDLDWEMAHEIERDRANGRFSAMSGAGRENQKNEKETVFNGPRASSEGSSDGVPDSQSDASPLRLRRKSGGTRKIVANDGKKVKAHIRSFNNNDFSIGVGKDRPIGAIIKSLCKTLELRQKGSYNSHYGIFDTPSGKVAFRLSTHKAIGENFRQDAAARNTSVVIETYDIGNGETTVPYEEFIYPKDVFNANRKKIVAAIMNGVDKMIDTGRFVDSTGLAKYTDNKGPNFKRWFADSKVTDVDGKPLAVYHGSTWDPLAEKTGMAVFRTGQQTTGAGAHFGTRKAAEERAEGNRNWKIGKYYLSIKNPLEVADTGYWTPGDIVAEVRKTIKDFPWLETFEEIKTELQKRGYDGLKYKNVVEDEGSTSYVAFEPTQVKSATDNFGTFDPKNPDIRMSVGTRATIDPDVFVFDPNAKIVAMGNTEQNAAGLAAGIEKKEALRPWTKKMSPADMAKPIAFDAADMVMFWRAVSGSLRNPHVQKGERIAGRPNAIGLNVGGDRIEIVSKLFGVIDAGDIGGFADGLKDLKPEYRMTAVRHVLNGWRQYHADPRSKMLKGARSIKDPQLRKKAMEWIERGIKYED